MRPLVHSAVLQQRRRFQECLWGSERKVADVDTQGVEDPKLFVWPGRGVYAVFGRKPEALGASPYCRDPVFVQFVVQVGVVFLGARSGLQGSQYIYSSGGGGGGQQRHPVLQQQQQHVY